MSSLRVAFSLLGIAWREDPKRLSCALPLMLLQSIALPLAAGALGVLTDAAMAGDVIRATLGAIAMAALVVASLTAGHFAHIFYFELGDMLMLRLECELIELSNGTIGLEHHECPGYADKLQVLREEVRRAGSNALGALLGSIGLGVAIVITGLLLGMVNPWLLLLPLAAIPPLLLGRRAEAARARAREAAASESLLARHLLQLATDAGSAKELRARGLEHEIRSRHAATWARASEMIWGGERRAAALLVTGQLVFAMAYVGATLLVVWDSIEGRRSVGDVILAIALAAQVNQQVTTAVTFHQELQRIASTLSGIDWMRALVAPQSAAHAEATPPDSIEHGMTFNDVSFGYPGTERNILEGVNLCFPAGSTVALVGENGAGKSTLIKLICGFYAPRSGSITVDGVDVRHFPQHSWRERIAAGFQDFVRFEFRAREAVGVGHLPDVGSDEAVLGALRRARADDLLDRLEMGLDTELGKSNPNGTELSGGQWQKLALGRTMMRPKPLLLVLDEPTSALDARAEHLLFERYAENAKRVRRGSGAITVLVSHRFSTVRMADQIVVVAGKGVSEVGSHDELMRLGGLYAELYTLQARAYQ